MKTMSASAVRYLGRARAPLALILATGCQLIGGIGDRIIVERAAPAGGAAGQAGTGGSSPGSGGDGGEAGSGASAGSSASAGTAGTAAGGAAGTAAGGSGGSQPGPIHNYSYLFGDAHDQAVYDVGGVAEVTDNLVFALGGFRGSVLFGGSVQELHADSDGDLFVVGFDPEGRAAMVAAIDADPPPAEGALSTHNGDPIFVAGTFSGTLASGPGFDLVSETTDIFLMGFDGAGTPTLAKSYGGLLDQHALDITSQGQSLFITGFFQGELDFGGTAAPASAPEYQSYVAKLDSAGSGEWLLAFQGCPGLGLTSVASSSSNEIVVAGTYSGDCDLDSVSLPSTETADCAVLKLNGTGDLVWARALQAPYCTVGDVDVDTSGVVLSGGLEGSSALPGLTASDRDLFVARWNTEGDFRWGRTLPRQGIDASYSVDLENGQIFVVGTGESGLVIQKYDYLGPLTWTREWPIPAAFDKPGPFATAAFGRHLFVAGTLLKPADLGGGTLTPAGDAASDVFIALYE